MPDPKESENLVNQSMMLDEFLSSLVQSVAKSQTALEAYYRNGEGKKSSVAYTIPSVSLEMKMNFTMTKTRGIAFFFKKTKETSTEVFSSLKLNLNAMPNPQFSEGADEYRIREGEAPADIAKNHDVIF